MKINYHIAIILGTVFLFSCSQKSENRSSTSASYATNPVELSPCVYRIVNNTTKTYIHNGRYLREYPKTYTLMPGETPSPELAFNIKSVSADIEVNGACKMNGWLEAPEYHRWRNIVEYEIDEEVFLYFQKSEYSWEQYPHFTAKRNETDYESTISRMYKIIDNIDPDTYKISFPECGEVHEDYLHERFCKSLENDKPGSFSGPFKEPQRRRRYF